VIKAAIKNQKQDRKVNRPAIKAEVRRYIEKWRPRLFLGEWFIELLFPEEDLGSENGYSTLANVCADPTYLNAKIQVFPAFFAAPKDVREHAIVHELCHCLTQEAWDTAGRMRDGGLVNESELTKVVERLTQRIANVAFKNEFVSKR
jgi:hypothetical protein